jgi:hypothetical protein
VRQEAQAGTELGLTQDYNTIPWLERVEFGGFAVQADQRAGRRFHAPGATADAYYL